MLYNILVGGTAGQGMDTVSDLLEKAFKQNGLHVFSNKDYMSRVRGGHNFTQIRFGNEEVFTHSHVLDVILALDENTVNIHKDRLKEGGIMLGDEDLKVEDPKLKKLPMMKLAKEAGMMRAFTTVAAGAILSYFGLSAEPSKLFPAKFTEEVKVANETAFYKGIGLLAAGQKVELGNKSNQLLLNGNQAIALGAIVGGLDFYAAYPMTPATSIMTHLAKKQVDVGYVLEQAEDEISAINMAIGASYAGARSMTASSGGGVALMVEALGLAGIAEIPLVVVDSQRPGPATGLPTRTEQSDLSFLLTASHGEFPRVVMSVRNPEDAFYQTFKALNLADKYQAVVLMLTDQYIADAQVSVPNFKLDELVIDKGIVDKVEGTYNRYVVTPNGISPRLIPGKLEGQVVIIDSDEHTEEGHITEAEDVRNAQMEKRMRKLQGLAAEVEEPICFGDEDAEIVLIGWGSTYGALKEATEILVRQGVKIAALSFGDIYPLPQKHLRNYSSKAKHLINVEQNYTGQLGKLIASETGILMTDSILKYDGRQINGEEVVAEVKKVVGLC